MALTATASKTLRHSLSKTIGLKDPYVLAMCPSKHNLMYAVGEFTSIEELFQPFVRKLSFMRTNMHRVIVYCHRFEDCSDIYMYFKACLAENFTEPPGAPNLPRFRLIDIIYKCY